MCIKRVLEEGDEQPGVCWVSMSLFLSAFRASVDKKGVVRGFLVKELLIKIVLGPS